MTVMNPLQALHDCNDVYVTILGGTDSIEARLNPDEAVNLVRNHPMQFTVVWFHDIGEADLEPRAPGQPRLRIEETR